MAALLNPSLFASKIRRAAFVSARAVLLQNVDFHDTIQLFTSVQLKELTVTLNKLTCMLICMCTGEFVCVRVRV